jgi:hypothetical protein
MKRTTRVRQMRCGGSARCDAHLLGSWMRDMFDCRWGL